MAHRILRNSQQTLRRAMFFSPPLPHLHRIYHQDRDWITAYFCNTYCKTLIQSLLQQTILEIIIPKRHNFNDHTIEISFLTCKRQLKDIHINLRIAKKVSLKRLAQRVWEGEGTGFRS